MRRLVFAALALVGAASLAAPEVPWFDGGRPGAPAQQAVEVLAAAASHGLEPQDYDAAALGQAVAQAAQATMPEAAAVAQLEQALTTAMQRYLADLHGGRIDPRQVHQDFDPPRRDDFDPSTYLLAALQDGRLREASDAAAPRLPQYQRLREALERYRGLVDHPAWRQPLPPLPRGRGILGAVQPGQPYPGLALLAQRLAALGDLAPDSPLPSRYEGALPLAVESFQQRHGLAADGVIGQATLAQLEVPPAARVRQIELTMERLRWTPLEQAPRMIVVNVPEFVLRAYEVQDGRINVRHEMKVVVGKALDKRTPIFDEDMRLIEFSPYWNIPPSIARAETVPRLRRESGYFAQQGLEFVAPDGRVRTTLSTAALDEVLAGTLRVRQRPGPQNALGKIKFVFPNRDNIYLHDTPATGLFARERRDFSHGCIRVEQPLALAEFVLQGMPEWSEERIHQAMEAGESTTLRLARPLPVLIAYGTALVKGGRIHFFEDIYGHDRLLDAALQERTRNR